MASSSIEEAVVASQQPVAAADPGRPPIPVLRPQLPRAQALLPYLERIDATRVYSNWGPLVTELTDRLTTKLAAPAGGLVCANSGMQALVGAILAHAGRARSEAPLAIIPDYTFTASALAAQMCGYQPVLASVAADTWTFSPADLEGGGQRGVLDRTGLVMPVAPYGRLVAQAPWLEFQARTGIPVVIDGAACFDLLVDGHAGALGPLPVALSFHATKAFATGEGGGVITTDPLTSEKILRCLNFGFLEARNTAMPGTNGKMSEYTAAVGLAELDGWDGKRAAALRVFRAYEGAFAAGSIDGHLFGAPHISCAYVLLACPTPARARAAVAALARDAIDTRFWYGDGLHAHDAFERSPLLPLHGKDALDPRTIVGLPVATDLQVGDVLRICDVIGAGMRSAA